jgi:hypothetical protein
MIERRRFLGGLGASIAGLFGASRVKAETPRPAIAKAGALTVKETDWQRRYPDAQLYFTRGKTITFARQTPNADGTWGGIFDGSEPISVGLSPQWRGGRESFWGASAGSWIKPQESVWAVTFLGDETAMLQRGLYHMVVTARTSCDEIAFLFDGSLEVV